MNNNDVNRRLSMRSSSTSSSTTMTDANGSVTLSTSDPDPDIVAAASVDALLANELNKLSFQERESINEEIHGVDVRNIGVEETPQLLKESFLQLDKELEQIRPGRVAFDRSQKLFGSTTYLNTEEFRIMFLRCDLFDCRKAAIRICDFADLVHEIYGDVALRRRTYITDMTELERRILIAGYYQALPGRDRAGRRILGNFAFDAPKSFSIQSRLRVGLYCILSVLEDVETQRKGIIGMSWWHNVRVDDFILRGKVHKRINCAPIRLGALHCCIPSECSGSSIQNDDKNNPGSSNGGVSPGLSEVIKAMFVLSIGSKLRPHFRMHTGSAVECMYALQSFGIHSDQIPINSSTGRLKTKQHSKWLHLCQLKEDSLKKHGCKFDRIIECPQPADVLFGRGRPIMRHPGNAIMRDIVHSRLEEYSKSRSKKESIQVTWDVVRLLKGKYGARFLKEENVENNGLGWVEVSNDTARSKVRIAFRDARTKILKSAEMETTNNTATINSATINTAKDMCAVDSSNTKRKSEAATVSSLSAAIPFRKIDSQVQHNDSSTSAFLAMNGNQNTNTGKRPRLCQTYFDFDKCGITTATATTNNVTDPPPTTMS